MQVGRDGYFVDNNVGIERNSAGQQLPPKMFGKYFREPNDPLVVRQIPNDLTLPWAKEIINAWHIDAPKDVKGRLKATRFESREAYDAAIESGKYFDSPVKAQDAKKNKLNKKLEDVEKALDENVEELKEVAAAKKPGRPKANAVQVAE